MNRFEVGLDGLAMTRGQESLTIDVVASAGTATGPLADGELDAVTVLVLAPSAEEIAAHRAYLAELDRESKGACMWLALAGAA